MQKSEGRLIAGRYDGREGLGSDLSPALLTSLRSCKTISGAYKDGNTKSVIMVSSAVFCLVFDFVVDGFVVDAFAVVSFVVVSFKVDDFVVGGSAIVASTVVGIVPVVAAIVVTSVLVVGLLVVGIAVVDFAVVDFAVVDFAVVDLIEVDFAVADFAVVDFVVAGFFLGFALVDFDIDVAVLLVVFCRGSVDMEFVIESYCQGVVLHQLTKFVNDIPKVTFCVCVVFLLDDMKGNFPRLKVMKITAFNCSLILNEFFQAQSPNICTKFLKSSCLKTQIFE
ncbi:hypothetical protein pdam_00003239 [Pocillopora damicornis]|uniref:Uncharacterized protein n=1 Tax=Pocillopora damicornis TaxID=46731 RepID=A0A3M6TI59_POCDA|nr:hypothetical protein pdam_00003239 [Pocillopora damicornis]